MAIEPNLCYKLRRILLACCMRASMTVVSAYSALSGISLTLASTTFSLPAFSQAMAESVLLGAGSSTATVSAGSALNSSLNRSSKHLAGRVQQQVSRPPQAKTPPSVKHLLPNARNSGTADRRAPQSGDLTVSIKGAELNCAVTNEQTSAGQGTGTGQAPTNCLSRNTSGKSGPTKYKSVVTVTFPN
jgi:hypothetical protein